MEKCVIYLASGSARRVEELVRAALPRGVRVEGGLQAPGDALIASAPGTWFRRAPRLGVRYDDRFTADEQAKIAFAAALTTLRSDLNHIISVAHQDIQGQLLDWYGTVIGSVNLEADPRLAGTFEPVVASLLAEGGIALVNPSRLFTASGAQYFVGGEFAMLLDGHGNSQVESIDPPPESRVPDPELGRGEMRTPEEILERCYALLVVAGRAGGVAPDLLEQHVERLDITGFSTSERTYLSTASPTAPEHELALLNYESILVLLWALGLVPELPALTVPANVDSVTNILLAPTRDVLLTGSRIRSTAEVAAELTRNEPTGEVPPVLRARYRALRWLLGGAIQIWEGAR